jgi:hypothetical protein
MPDEHYISSNRSVSYDSFNPLSPRILYTTVLPSSVVIDLKNIMNFITSSNLFEGF